MQDLTTVVLISQQESETYFDEGMEDDDGSIEATRI
jgi:hypothetical protein